MFRFFGKKLNEQKGFTLIELIVVIAIIGILAAIIIPRVGSFRDGADKAQREANERTLISAGQMLIAAEGLTDAAGTYAKPGEGTTHKLMEYLSEWPDGIHSVTINTDGEIIVNETDPDA